MEFRKTTRRYPRAVGWNAQRGPHGKDQDVHACRIFTDQGASGWGFCGASEEAPRRLIGRKLPDLFSAETGADFEARCLDIALHDLAGRILGQPVWRMLGARAGNRIPIYSGAIYFDDLNPQGEAPGVERLIENCRQDAAAGHAHFKLKIGRGAKYMERAAGDARDIEVTRLVREHFPNAKILVDGNDGYDPAGACRYLDAVADCNLYWIEEIFAETEDGLRVLREAIRAKSPATLIAEGESRHGRMQDPAGPLGKWEESHVDELIALGAKKLIDVLLMDIGAMGFTAWRSVMPKVQAAGAQGSPHAWSEPFKTYYAAQLGCGLGSVPIVEGVFGTVDGVDASGYTVKDGMLTLPDAPGFGMTLH
ncbi:MAG: mandelate racemase [Planctomycetota bacterium]|nr:mandelate racemase [Planctomycetota bacterium]